MTIPYVQRKRKSRKNGSHSTLSLLRKELQEGNLQTLFGGSSCILSSSNVAPDPLLSSFILPMADDIVISQSQSSADTSAANKVREEIVLERLVLSCLLPFFPTLKPFALVDLCLLIFCKGLLDNNC